ncbi:hypothetical protein [Pseudopontixanthobacter vadosimaris]|uniref:hypothetical protein n=1 Tax=Pseudopontixanthobacter vadosimaris TaxID=2726450 RepID=UPI0030B89F0D
MGEDLFLLAERNGSKLWRLNIVITDKEKLLSFGAYPVRSRSVSCQTGFMVAICCLLPPDGRGAS